MINNIIITNTAIDVLRAPVDGTLAGVGMFLCNAGAVDETLNLYAVQKEAAASSLNIVIKDLLVKTGETYEFSAEKFLLDKGEGIVGSGANGGLVSATVTYTEI